jgi:formylglycine-generating enzyme required for sulfatase activity
MHGNVFEWCQDLYDAYPGGIALDPQGPAMGSVRVIRGGYWRGTRGCRSARRLAGVPGAGRNGFGFRVVLAPGQ